MHRITILILITFTLYTTNAVSSEAKHETKISRHQDAAVALAALFLDPSSTYIQQKTCQLCSQTTTPQASFISAVLQPSESALAKMKHERAKLGQHIAQLAFTSGKNAAIDNVGEYRVTVTQYPDPYPDVNASAAKHVTTYSFTRPDKLVISLECIGEEINSPCAFKRPERSQAA